MDMEIGAAILQVISKVLLFALIWGLAVFLFAHISGWAQLARTYRTTRRCNGRMKRDIGTRLRGIPYKRALSIGTDIEGLHLRIAFFYRVAHPPLLIPWSDVVIEKRDGRFGGVYARFRFPRYPSITLQTTKSLATQVGIRESAYVGIHLNP